MKIKDNKPPSAEERFAELVSEVLEGFKGRVYRCYDVSECFKELARELDEELEEASSGYCIIEASGGNEVIIACGLLETYYVTIDYDVEETVRVEGFRVERAMSNAGKHEYGHEVKLVAVALGKLVGREFRSEGWLERLVRELEEELRKVSSECRVALYGASYTRGRVDSIYFAEVLIRCNEKPVFARIYVDFINYVRVTGTRVE
jgi:hypothetical protein